MTNNDYKNELDWLRNNWPLLGRFEYKPDEAVHTTIGRVAELLYLHAFGIGRLAVSTSPQPRCPECSGALSYTHNRVLSFFSCNGKCKGTFELHSAGDMVQFFKPATAQPKPTER